jgi:tRNA G18 (ribose-2'-O)-methylase SpoU
MDASGRLIPITSPDDPRLAPFQNLKERELAREGNRFIAESELVVRRLLASDFPVESVIAVEPRALELAQIARPEIPIYVASRELLQQVAGFRFHTGVIACGHRKQMPLVGEFAKTLPQRATLAVCPDLISAPNIGSLVRICAALGVDAMLLGERCCDPFWRQSIRISVGTIFSLPILRSENLLSDLALLRREHDFQMIATVADENATPLEQAHRGNRIGILFGNEWSGLTEEMTAACDHRVTIPMRTGIDSLNVSIAAGIFLYHFTR